MGKIKLYPTWTDAQNAALCRSRCNEVEGCVGFYYKTTQWCYILDSFIAFGKHYPTAYSACKRLP